MAWRVDDDDTVFEWSESVRGDVEDYPCSSSRTDVRLR